MEDWSHGTTVIFSALTGFVVAVVPLYVMVRKNRMTEKDVAAKLVMAEKEAATKLRQAEEESQAKLRQAEEDARFKLHQAEEEARVKLAHLEAQTTHQARQGDVEFMSDTYRQLIKDLQANFASLRKKVGKIQEDHAEDLSRLEASEKECRENEKRLSVKVEFQEDQIQKLSEQIQQLQNQQGGNP